MKRERKIDNINRNMVRYNVDVPIFIYDYFKNLGNINSEIETFFLLYKDLNNLSPHVCYYYETVKHKQKKRLGFYLNIEFSNMLGELAIANLRSRSNQATHLIYSFYEYLTSKSI